MPQPVTLDPITIMKHKSAILDTMMESLRKPINAATPFGAINNLATAPQQMEMTNQEAWRGQLQNNPQQFQRPTVPQPQIPQQTMSGVGIGIVGEPKSPQQSPQGGGGQFWMELARAIGVPAASAIIGMAAPGTLPAMAGLSQGYAGGYEKAQKNKTDLDKIRLAYGIKSNKKPTKIEIKKMAFDQVFKEMGGSAFGGMNLKGKDKGGKDKLSEFNRRVSDREKQIERETGTSENETETIDTDGSSDQEYQNYLNIIGNL